MNLLVCVVHLCLVSVQAAGVGIANGQARVSKQSERGLKVGTPGPSPSDVKNLPETIRCRRQKKDFVVQVAKGEGA